MLKLGVCARSSPVTTSNVRCIWDGRGASMPPVAPGPNGAWEEALSQEARVHVSGAWTTRQSGGPVHLAQRAV